MSSVDFWSSPRDRGFRRSVVANFKEAPASGSIIAAREGDRACRRCDSAKTVLRKLSGHRLGERKAQRLDDGIVNRRPYLTDLLVGASGIHAIGKQDDE